MYEQGQTVIQLMEQLAPKHYAVEGDKIGLQLGTLQKQVQKVLVALDVTEAVVEEAIDTGAELIIAHHAIIYRPLARLDTSTPAGRLYEKLIKHDIAVYIAHTNLDVAPGGINDWMAEMLGLEQTKVLDELQRDKLYKLVCYVPAEHQRSLQQAIWQAGAGALGDYSCCSYVSEGMGSFLPGAQARPHIGAPGQLERVAEARIETIVPHSIHRRVVQAMRKAHPYEEPAYDLIALQQEGQAYGLGRVGRLAEAITLGELAERAKQAFGVPALRLTGDPQRLVRRIAVLGGSGGRYVRHALMSGADVLVTGDLDYHTAHDAAAAGLALLDPGHNIEKLMKPRVAEWLNAQLQKRGSATVAAASQIDTEPFVFC
ncbi:Nif3-like dinuclear metal center hexameric protein [Paenibacillus sp. IB182496]|uniref:GTP cyclohydrolase 1 type 2 homolog n=1 Tax=Paenibacillus sabuli TaxID=2772509 RepID=A0A927BRZ4_9BACL|nr:Nif3-like dinuclear metal center hexameric protein [Paenibacillus sabuli]MBD2844434.1 Nif3-like dinuclear metal center hexameric protein [Paenibacillus sabuli]